MKIANLSKGQVFKNYKTLCAELGVKPKAGKGKKYHLMEMERFFSMEKVANSNKLFIKEIYDAPKEKLGIGKHEGSRKNNGEYIHILELLILDSLVLSEYKKVIKTKNQLLLGMKMTNENYIECYRLSTQLALYAGVDPVTVNDFYSLSYDNLDRLIRRAFHSLRERELIDVKNVFVLKHRNAQDHAVASERERRFLLECEGQILRRMGFKIITEVYVKGRTYEFYRQVNKIVRQNDDLNIDFYYKAFEIKLNERGVERTYKSILNLLLDKEERHEYKLHINEKVITKFLHNTKKRHEKAKSEKEKSLGTRKITINRVRENENYITDMEKLLELLIKPHKSIVEDVKHTATKALADKIDSFFAN
ncbi:hypothetical protein J2S74_005286 [Evansella vedderi]|uniref:Uncharacterized protein n=1 Tax=Evansella vedderi TaxID=38282 RepID=A0ABU0A2V7_9BACI|nr:hypothetical protein [Evansella vedderi]MDQ0257823.1 hypothetical protein [Evansella vedderi]